MSAMQWLLPLLTVWPPMVTSRLISTVPYVPNVYSIHVFWICPKGLSTVSGYTADTPPEMSAHEIVVEAPGERPVVISGATPLVMKDAE
jgi:hypothetical protein